MKTLNTMLVLALLAGAGPSWLRAEEEASRRDYAKGMQAVAQEDWSGAAKQFARAVEEKKNYAEAYNKLGLAEFNLGRNDLAINHFKQAVFLNPRLAEAWYNMGRGYEALAHLKNRDEVAVVKYEKALEAAAENDEQTATQTHFYLGLVRKRLALRAAAKAAEAQNLTSTAMNLNPTADEKMAMDLHPAIDDLEAAVKGDQDWAEAHNELGRLYDIVGRYPEAIREYDAAIKNFKEYPQAYTNRGVAFWHDGNWDNALRDCRKAVELDPKFAGGHYNLAEVLQAHIEVIKLGQLSSVYHEEAERAIDEYNQATGLDPNFLEAWFGLAQAYRGYHDYDNSVATYKKILKMRKWNKTALANLAEMNKEQKSFMSHYPKPTPTPEQ
jgi:tetratricopeptide (TPR) repeat protein